MRVMTQYDEAKAKLVIHLLRNPYGHTPAEMEMARRAAADMLDFLVFDAKPDFQHWDFYPKGRDHDAAPLTPGPGRRTP